MSPPDDSVPEPIPDRPAEATGEISQLPPEQAQAIAAEIKAIAESRGEDSEVVELVELHHEQSRRSKRTTIVPPMPAVAEQPAPPEPSDDELTADELHDAWPLLDLEERADGLRVLPREDAEDYFIGLNPTDQAALLQHFRPGQRRQWMRLLEPDDVADVIQTVPEVNRAGDAGRGGSAGGARLDRWG
ncbi:MAG: hypothetical protein H0T46_21600 [Deltaproteobacteria bacterium]|nr:hypothetical protein [Deltaproteobacteria bacterium]